MKDNLKKLFGWLWINLFFCITFFVLTLLFILLFPSAMLNLFGNWASLMKAVGGKNITEFVSQSDMFTHILRTNGITLVIFFVIGLLLQSPLAMIFTGAFYSLTAFLAPVTMRKSFGWNDWMLIALELFTLVLSISVSSALAGDLFSVEPNIRSLLKYWKNNWNQLFPKPLVDWKTVLQKWYGTMFIVAAIIFLFSIFVAWFETYGY